MPTYVALGSSFASGPGIDPILDARCGRSGSNYAHLVAERLGYDLVDITCGGATVDDVASRPQALMLGGTVPPQIEALGPDAELVTITVGGNDVEYMLTLGRCSYRVAPAAAPPGAGEFFGTPATPAAADAALAALPGKLAGLVSAVRDRAPRARVLLVDYLTVLPEGGGCSALPMSEEDQRSCADLGRRLEAATAEAARASGADLVTASAISRDHTVCDPEPWVTGWEFGDLLAGGVAPYHPNAAGMRAVADLVVHHLCGERSTLRAVPTEEYLLDNQAAQASDRFGALSALFDPWTFRHVDALGIAPGWRCWEVGAGGPSVPDGLSARVGPGGRVLTTDLETRWLAGRVAPGVEVTVHDVAHDDPPDGGFDLVHARLVLIHVPAREEAVRRMVSALRPGGWLLIEDFDIALQPLLCPDEVTADQRLANRVKAEFRQLLLDRGADTEFGRRLPRMFRDAGLVEVGADAYFPLAVPGVAVLESANVEQVRDGLVALGNVTGADVDRYLELMASGDLDLATAPLVSAWGRRPAD